MLSLFGGSGPRYQRPLSSPWAVIQCPQCRFFWSKTRKTWQLCDWLSPELVELCLSQVEGQILPEASSAVFPNSLPINCSNSDSSSNSRSSSRCCCHSQISKARQHPTSVYSNWIQVEVTIQRRVSISGGSAVSVSSNILPTVEMEEEEGLSIVDDVTTRCQTSRNQAELVIGEDSIGQPQELIGSVSNEVPATTANTGVRETVEETRLDYSFNVRYTLCNSCSSKEVVLTPCPEPKGQWETFQQGSRQAVRSLGSFLKRLTTGCVGSLHQTCRAKGRRIASIPISVRSSLGQHSTLSTVSGDCIQLMLQYLPVESLFEVLQVNKFWHAKVMTYEFSGDSSSSSSSWGFDKMFKEERQFARLVEAWNHTSARTGVYVNLDHFFSSATSRWNGEVLDGIYMGGYAQLLPATELVLVGNESKGSRKYRTNFGGKLVMTPSSSKQFEYAKPFPASVNYQASPVRSCAASTFSANFSKERSKQQQLLATILECLPARQKALLTFLRTHYQLVVEGDPVLSRGTLLFPYVVPFHCTRESLLFPSRDGSLNSNNLNSITPCTRRIAFHVSFVLSC